MVKISVMMSTVRNNYPYVNHPQMFIFKPTIMSLLQQTFDDFELVLMDYRKDIRGAVTTDKCGFTIKHERPKASMWDAIRYPAIYNGFNSAIIHSDGELCVLIGDCCELHPEFLTRCWYWYKKGYFAAAIVDVENNHRTDGMFRKNLLRQQEYCAMGGRQACWGYNSYTLDALLKINGFDENFDGSNHQGDDDLGVRIQKAGYKYILDSKMKAFEYQHNNPSATKDYLCGKKAKSNDLYFDFKWRTRLMTGIQANTGAFDRHAFKQYQNADYMKMKAYYRSQPEYIRIRDKYIGNPSRFNLKQLWEQRKAKK